MADADWKKIEKERKKYNAPIKTVNPKKGKIKTINKIKRPKKYQF